MVSRIAKSITVKGELYLSDDVTIEGRIDGPISCEYSSVVIAASASVTGQIIAREITVFGHATGQLIATEVVDIRADATVSGQIVARRFILDGQASFNGRVAPQQLEAALRVARYQRRQRDGATEGTTDSATVEGMDQESGARDERPGVEFA